MPGGWGGGVRGDLEQRSGDAIDVIIGGRGRHAAQGAEGVGEVSVVLVHRTHQGHRHILVVRKETLPPQHT